jgi:hypothetical protein
MIKIFLKNISPITENELMEILKRTVETAFSRYSGTIESTRAKIKTDLREEKQ